MRIGSSILIKNNYCYQSYGWQLLRPLGELQNAVNHLEEYGCDEISIIRPVRHSDQDFTNDLQALNSLETMTPISFGGGIRDQSHLHLISSLPVERLVFSSAFIHSNHSLIKAAVRFYGRQAIQCLLPFVLNSEGFFIYDSSNESYLPFDEIESKFIDEYANEIIFHDTANEGFYDKFNLDVLEASFFDTNKIIVSGGIGLTVCSQSSSMNCASVLIENRLLHKEYSIERYRSGV
jgi:phosphoribosylformimino-5-aminoimidazole carboxamide ribonucleotide (ProFAR) isomerase